MDKLKICRICLVGNVRMHNVLDNKLQEFYENITSVPIETADSKPTLLCYMCYARLRKCYQFVTKCLETEKMLSDMLHGENKITNKAQGNVVLFNSLSVQSAFHINIETQCNTEDCNVKEEIPDVLEQDVLKIGGEIEFELEGITNSNQQVGKVPRYSDDQALVTRIKAEEPERLYRKKRLYNGQEPMLDTSNEVMNMGQVENNVDSDIEKNIYETIFTSNPSDREYVIEIETEHLENPYTCDLCLKSFCNRSALKIHSLGHTGEKPYSCDICKRSFKQKGALTVHTRVHTGEKPYACDICKRNFSEKGTLNNHIRAHTGEKRYKCDICQHRFLKKAHLNVHMNTHLGLSKVKNFKCDICFKTFSQKVHLTTHIRSHTGERPFKCDICSHTFSSKDVLNKHMVVHTSDRPYKCDVCGKSYRRKNHLNDHIRTHTGEKPHKCDICNSRFNEKVALKRHLLVHTGEKPYECDICKRSFGFKGYLNAHIKLKHK